MRLLIAANVYGWNMTGLLGKDAAWFIGFSTKGKSRTITPEQIAAAGERAMRKMREQFPQNNGRMG